MAKNDYESKGGGGDSIPNVAKPAYTKLISPPSHSKLMGWESYTDPKSGKTLQRKASKSGGGKHKPSGRKYSEKKALTPIKPGGLKPLLPGGLKIKKP